MPGSTTEGDTSGAGTGAGASAASGATGDSHAGYVPQATVDQIESLRRADQGARDRATARVTELEAQIAKNAAAAGTSTPAPALDEAAIARLIGAAFNQRDSLAQAKTALAAEFPSARGDVLNGNYQTPEEMGAAVKQSHDSEVAHAETVRAKYEAQVRAEFKAKFGYEAAPQVPPVEGANGERKYTASDLEQMPLSDFLKLDPKVRQAALAGG